MSIVQTIDYRLIFALMNGKVSNAFRKRMNEDFRAAGLEIRGDQLDVLLAINMSDLCTQQDLCDATSLSKPTMSRIISGLEEARLVERRKARVDFRNNYISLTSKGMALADVAQAIAVRTLKESLKGISKMDVMIAQHSLNTVLQNLREKEQQIADEQSEDHRRRSEASRRAVRRMHGDDTRGRK